MVEWDGASVADLCGDAIDARTRVHEYGGGAVWYHEDSIFASDAATGRLFRLERGSRPVVITPEVHTPHELRYADGSVTPNGREIICVRERHSDGQVHNELVVLPVDGSHVPTVVAQGHDFFAAPRIDPTGRQLAWLTWDHPNMPWDGTELWVGNLAPDGGRLSNVKRVAGGKRESVVDPQWSADSTLHFCSDRTGWWNLYRVSENGSHSALTGLTDAEIGYPMWVLGQRRYAFLGDGRVVCVVTRKACDSLELLDPETLQLEKTRLSWTAFSPTALAAEGSIVAFAAAAPTEPETIVVWDASTGTEERIRRSIDLKLPPATVATPHPIVFPTSDGGHAHAFFYQPSSDLWEGSPGEMPPLRVLCHGGPTSHAVPAINPRTQFFTQRGFGVVEVNYRGSSGFGREYRRQLGGRWGDLDWRDCVEAARYLASEGKADPERTWVEGISAGGYVVLCSLAYEPTAFAAGVSVCGVADTAMLSRETHKFESCYIDRMVGASSKDAERHRERSPIRFAHQFERPLLLLQGLNDEIVPANQAEAMVAALDHKNVPHAYLVFAGEGHAFRGEQSLERALTATLTFVSRIFGIDSPDAVEPLDVTHLKKRVTSREAGGETPGASRSRRERR